MRRNHWIYSFFVLFLGVWISGCAVRPIATSTIGAIDSKERLLIATQDSEFKDTVVSNVIKEFEKEKVFIEVIDLANLTRKSTKDYEAIVIMNEYKFFSINRHVKQFMKCVDENDKKKIVLLTTAGHPRLMIKGAEVDAISSASRIAKADSVSEMIIQRVSRILSSD